MREGENRNGENNDGARGVEHHDEAAAVFTVDDDAAENHQHHGGESGKYGQRAESYFRSGGLQDVPRHGCGVHTAPDHGDDVGGEYVLQGTFLKEKSHLLKSK